MPDTIEHTILLTPEEKAFIEAFEESTLPPGGFHHRDHVRLAWLYLGLYAVPTALARYMDGLQRFAAAHGKEGLYHETITYAFIFLINERMQRQGRDGSWEAFAARNADLLAGGLAFLDAYYRPETLASDVARAVFVMHSKTDFLLQEVWCGLNGRGIIVLETGLSLWSTAIPQHWSFHRYTISPFTTHSAIVS